jgi:integrase/recombinase XerD
LDRFHTWCVDRGIESVAEVTPAVLAAYRRYLFHYRNPKTGRALKYSTQTSYLISVRRWFRWLAKEKLLPEDMARDLELPKEEQRLPAQVLTVDQVESLLNATDVTTPLGVRDRALLETFYSTAVRCSELIALQVYDLEADRGVVRVLQGKGRKDRFVPIGKRALQWLERYLMDVRPALVMRTNETTLFVSCQGKRFCRTNVSALVRRYIERSGITVRGSCHLLRHTAATLMLDNGADLRSLQLYLGHEHLNTTQIYTHVSIDRLKEVHARAHPARPACSQNTQVVD